MSNVKTSEAPKPDDADKAKPEESTNASAWMSDEELAQVSAGINPQPVPPIVHDRQ